MCTDCGCELTSAGTVHVGGRPLAVHGSTTVQVDLAAQLHAANLADADHNRAHCDARGVLAVNLMSAPGSGKTALLEATIRRYRSSRSMAVIEGDLETENDAARIRRHGVPAIQITTGSACHLDAAMVHAALHDLAHLPLDLLFIENVGNLVCPASFDVGAHANVALLSMAEGDDKPAKYPVMFRTADLVLVTKADLAAVFDDFSVDRATRYLREVGCAAPVLCVSARSGVGIDAWWAWLEAARQRVGHGPHRHQAAPLAPGHTHAAATTASGAPR